MTTIDSQGNIHDRTGQFAEKQNSAPAGTLATADAAGCDVCGMADRLPGKTYCEDCKPAWTPGEKLEATVNYEQWRGDDAIYVGQETFDVVSILDTVPLDELEDPDDLGAGSLDYLFETLQYQGVSMHSGPFTVSFDNEEQYAAYVEHRRENDLAAPVAAHPRFEMSALEKNLQQARWELEAAQQRVHQLQKNIIRELTRDAVPGAQMVIVHPGAYPIFRGGAERPGGMTKEIRVAPEVYMPIAEKLQALGVTGSIDL